MNRPSEAQLFELVRRACVDEIDIAGLQAAEDLTRAVILNESVDLVSSPYGSSFDVKAALEIILLVAHAGVTAWGIMEPTKSLPRPELRAALIQELKNENIKLDDGQLDALTQWIEEFRREK